MAGCRRPDSSLLTLFPVKKGHDFRYLTGYALPFYIVSLRPSLSQDISRQPVRRLRDRRPEERFPERVLIVVKRQGHIFRFPLEAGDNGMAFRDREYKRGIHCLFLIIVNGVPVFRRTVVAFLQWTVMLLRSVKRRLRRITVRAGILQDKRYHY